MLVFAHVGITLGAATLLANLALRRQSSGEATEEDVGSATGRLAATLSGGRRSTPGASWVRTLARYLDIRFLLVGSLLPDIIDKPVGHVLFRDTFSSGRIFGHTLLFAVVLGVAGIYLYRRHHRKWLVTLAAGSLAHLVLDSMWGNPQTLLWPLYGVAFRSEDLTGWTSDIVRGLFAEPGVYVPELVGLAVVIWSLWVLWRGRTLSAFVRYGKVRWPAGHEMVRARVAEPGSSKGGEIREQD